MSMLRLPKEISKIMKTIEKDGHQIYVVGGSLRICCWAWNPKMGPGRKCPSQRVSELFKKSDDEGEDAV